MTEYFTVENEEGDRIDRYLAEEMPERSRSYLQKLIKEQYIKVNNKPVKANYRLVLGDRVEVCIPEAKEPDIEPENIPLDILYEDEDVIVVNKPKQMVVHPAPGHYSGTLVNALMYHCGNELSGINGTSRPGIVHRIDMDTTGSLIICKNDMAHQSLAVQLKEHSINRIYEAIVHGNIKEEEGTVNAPIGRHPTDRKKMSIHAKNARNAITHYKVLKRFERYTYMEFQLETGRTHQIRAHMKHIGHPLFMDETYGGTEILRGQRSSSYKAFIQNCFKLCPRQALHAKTLGFVHPTTKQQMDFDSEWPNDFRQLIEKWRGFIAGTTQDTFKNI